MGSYSAELYKLARRPAVWVLCVIWLALLLAFEYVIPFYKYRAAPHAAGSQTTLTALLPADLPAHAISGYSLFGGALILVLGALTWGSEYSWGTIKTVFTVGPRRVSVYTTQLFSLSTVLAVLVCIAFASSGVSSDLIAHLVNARFQPLQLSNVLLAVGAGWLILLMWCLLGCTLAILTRGTALSIGFGLVWILVIELLIGSASKINFFEAIDKFLPGVNAGALADAIGSSVTTTTSVVSGVHGLVMTIIYIILFSSAGAAILVRRDVH